MKIFILILILLPALCFADAPDRRISDNAGEVVAITSNSLTLSTDAPVTNPNSNGSAPDRRISDNDDDILTINSNGSINVEITN